MDLDKIRQVAEEYKAMGYPLSVRQLYYMLTDAPTERGCEDLNRFIMRAKLDKSLGWSLVDEPRGILHNTGIGYDYGSPAGALQTLSREYRLDPWDTQRWRPEVWIERATVASSIRGLCREMLVPWMVCSDEQSLVYRAAGRLMSYAQDFQQAPAVLLATDFDPAGIRRRENIQSVLTGLCGFEVKVYPVAITMDQVVAHGIRSSPEAVKDRDYIRLHGDFGYELEAMDPRALRKAVADTLAQLIDHDAWNQVLKQQAIDREYLQRVANSR